MIEIIEKIVLNARSVDYELVHSKSRKRELKDTRFIVMYLAKERYPKKSLAAIAGYYGQNHATCLHAIKIVNNLIDSDPGFKKDIALIKMEVDAELSEGTIERIIKERDSLIRIIEKYQNKLDGINELIKKLEGRESTVKPAVPNESIPFHNNFKSPFRELEPTNSKPYSGYRQHSL